jgi:hypothetical protein
MVIEHGYWLWSNAFSGVRKWPSKRDIVYALRNIRDPPPPSWQTKINFSWFLRYGYQIAWPDVLRQILKVYRLSFSVLVYHNIM